MRIKFVSDLNGMTVDVEADDVPARGDSVVVGAQIFEVVGRQWTVAAPIRRDRPASGQMAGVTIVLQPTGAADPLGPDTLLDADGEPWTRCENDRWHIGQKAFADKHHPSFCMGRSLDDLQDRYGPMRALGSVPR